MFESYIVALPISSKHHIQIGGQRAQIDRVTVSPVFSSRAGNCWTGPSARVTPRRRRYETVTAMVSIGRGRADISGCYRIGAGRLSPLPGSPRNRYLTGVDSREVTSLEVDTSFARLACLYTDCQKLFLGFLCSFQYAGKTILSSVVNLLENVFSVPFV